MSHRNLKMNETAVKTTTYEELEAQQEYDSPHWRTCVRDSISVKERNQLCSESAAYCATWAIQLILQCFYGCYRCNRYWCHVIENEVMDEYGLMLHVKVKERGKKGITEKLAATVYVLDYKPCHWYEQWNIKCWSSG